jgi:hypothetical protein
MKRVTALTLAAALGLSASPALSATPALSWYQGALKYRDSLVDAALVFAYYEKCNAGPIPSDLKGRAGEKLNMAGPSAAKEARGDVAALIKKLGVKRFCEEYRRELTTGENVVVVPGGERPMPGRTAGIWAADCGASEAPGRLESCQSYTRGLADGFILSLSFGRSPACIPESATTDELVHAGLNYWKEAESRGPLSCVGAPISRQCLAQGVAVRVEGE